MFSHLSPHDGPVVSGLEDFETVYAKNQPEYAPLRTLPAASGQSAISRWAPTDHQRRAIAAGADILLEVYHFGKPLSPTRVMVTDGRGQYFRQWFAVQTEAPYLQELAEEGNPIDEQHNPDPITFQARTDEWVLECFGEAEARDKRERNRRFTEESIELVQSTGFSREECHALVDYVFNRPAGDPVQEVGGVMVTLAALCNVLDLGMIQSGERELARVWTNIPEIRLKHAAKPRMVPREPAGEMAASAAVSRCIGYSAGCDGDLGEAHGPHCPEGTRSARMPHFGTE